MGRRGHGKGVALMPLERGTSRTVAANNFRELNAAPTKRSRKQKIAIVLNTMRESGAKIPRRGVVQTKD